MYLWLEIFFLFENKCQSMRSVAKILPSILKYAVSHSGLKYEKSEKFEKPH